MSGKHFTEGNEKIVARLVRDLFIIPRDKRSSCIVCGKHKFITHGHHVYPVSELAKLICAAELTFKQIAKIPVKYTWLCPNHHALFHLMSKSTRKDLDIIEDIGQEEYRSLEILFDLYAENSREITDYIMAVWNDSE